MADSKTVWEAPLVAISDFFKGISSYVTGEAIMGTLDAAQDRVEHITRRVIKTATLWVLFIIGLLFVLWGLGLFLTDFFQWHAGVGLILIGAGLVALMLLVKAFR
jgi:hypothetical protein